MLHRYIIQHFFHLGLQFIQFFLIGVIRKHEAKHSFPFMHKPQQTATVANSTIVIQEVSIRPVQPYQHIRCGMKRYKQSFGTLAQYPVVKTCSFIGQHGFDSLELYITAPCLTPAAGDPTQQKVMMFMPVIFTVMFINFPAGLVIYWLCNNILSIGQQWWMLCKA